MSIGEIITKSTYMIFAFMLKSLVKPYLLLYKYSLVIAISQPQIKMYLKRFHE